jgi:hypothetical protein
MRAVTGPGRWVWAVSGLVTAAVLAVPGTQLITGSGTGTLGFPMSGHPVPSVTVTRTMTVPQPVTSLTVQSYGGQVLVAAGPVRRVQVTETITYDQQAGGPPAVTQSLSGGRLSLGDPVCESSDCSVDFAVTVPPGLVVTVETGGGAVSVSGAAGADLDSSGGPVRATQISGPLTVTTGGGPLFVDGLTGPLRADTGGGDLVARGIAAATATVTTGGGMATIAFSAAPDTVSVSTDGGPATLAVPGGPYALTAESDGGPQWVGIATDPAARSSITVTSGGGPLQVGPPGARGNPG